MIVENFPFFLSCQTSSLIYYNIGTLPHQHGLVERRERKKKQRKKNSSLVACHDIKLLPAHANRFFKVNSRKDKNVGQNGSYEPQGRRAPP